ncbi:hypothetical protein [Streptomyces roseoverticillatus]|uniref:Uncharacterized protein n=1 Tax=Streptomyces roseoverticillatus TaxID=66429 RepID=A0ABV3J535_9ACTN
MLVDLGAVQRGSAELGLCIRNVGLTSGQARVTVQWPGTPATTLLPDPDAGRDALLQAIAAVGPARLADDEPAESASSPLAAHGWLLDELGRRSDAWYAYLAEPVELLRVETDGLRTTDVAVGRTSRGDVVEVRVPLAGLGADGMDAGLAYTSRRTRCDRRSPRPPAGRPDTGPAHVLHRPSGRGYGLRHWFIGTASSRFRRQPGLRRVREELSAYLLSTRSSRWSLMLRQKAAA